jgi:hypothetical protein
VKALETGGTFQFKAHVKGGPAKAIRKTVPVGGVNKTGKAVIGKVVTGKALTGKAVTGKAVTGKAVTGKAATRQGSDEAVTGEAVTGEAVTGEAVTGKAVMRQVSDDSSPPIRESSPPASAAVSLLLGLADASDDAATGSSLPNGNSL